MNDAAPPTPIDSPPGEAARLVREIAAFSGSPDRLLALLVRLQAGLVSASGAALLRVGEAADVLAAFPVLEPGAPPPPWMRGATGLAADACDAGRPVAAAHPQRAAEASILAVPLGELDEPNAVIVFQLETRADTLDRATEDAARLAAAALVIHRLHAQAAHRQLGTESLVAAIDIAAAANAEERFRGAATALVSRLAAPLRAERVSVGVRPTRSADATRIEAISGVDKLQRSARLVGDIEGAMDESIDQDLETFFPVSAEDAVIARQAEKLARQHGPAAVACVPLRHAGRPFAAIAVERDPNHPFAEPDLAALRLLADLIAPRMFDLHQSDQPVHLRVARTARRAAAALVGPRHPIWKLAAIVVVAFLAGSMILRGTDEANAPFVAQATERRAVAAPFDGFLVTVGARAGDAVAAGDRLAALDDADLRLQLAEAQARRTSLARSAEAARGRGEIAEAQITEAEIAETDARVALLQRRLARVSLAAPIAGVVLSAPDDFAAGSPVARGETLFEVAPLDPLRAEIAMAEDRLPSLEVGQRVRLVATGAPDEPIAGVVESIAPAATETEEPGGPPTFAVRVAIEGQPAWLRPGMEGVAHVDVGRRPYASIWTRELVNWIRLNLWL